MAMRSTVTEKLSETARMMVGQALATYQLNLRAHSLDLFGAGATVDRIADSLKRRKPGREKVHAVENALLVHLVGMYAAYGSKPIGLFGLAATQRIKALELLELLEPPKTAMRHLLLLEARAVTAVSNPAYSYLIERLAGELVEHM